MLSFDNKRCMLERVLRNNSYLNYVQEFYQEVLKITNMENIYDREKKLVSQGGIELKKQGRTQNFSSMAQKSEH